METKPEPEKGRFFFSSFFGCCDFLFSVLALRSPGLFFAGLGVG
jgi:hypothetical protein